MLPGIGGAVMSAQQSVFGTQWGKRHIIQGKRVVLGTAEINQTFGTVKTATLKRTGDKKQIEGAAADIQTFLLQNPRFEYSLSTIFDADVGLPGLGDMIILPLVNVYGFITDVTPKWDNSSERMLDIEAIHFDALIGEVPYAYNPTTGVYTPLDWGTYGGSNGSFGDSA